MYFVQTACRCVPLLLSTPYTLHPIPYLKYIYTVGSQTACRCVPLLLSTPLTTLNPLYPIPYPAPYTPPYTLHPTLSTPYTQHAHPTPYTLHSQPPIPNTRNLDVKVEVVDVFVGRKKFRQRHSSRLAHCRKKQSGKNE